MGENKLGWPAVVLIVFIILLALGYGIARIQLPSGVVIDVVQPTAPAPSNTEPSGIIKAYYAAYSNKDAATAWAMISDKAKEAADPLLNDAQRFSKFKERMQSYRSVVVISSKTISANPPAVEAEVTYYYMDNRPPETYICAFTLIPGQPRGWLIDSVTSRLKR